MNNKRTNWKLYTDLGLRGILYRAYIGKTIAREHAASWTTCACSEWNFPGRSRFIETAPEDPELRQAGKLFSQAISDHNIPLAHRTRLKIERIAKDLGYQKIEQ